MPLPYGNREAWRKRLADIEAKLPVGDSIDVDGREQYFRSTAPLAVISDALGAWFDGRATERPITGAFVAGTLPDDAPPIHRIAQDVARWVAANPGPPPDQVDTGLLPEMDGEAL